MGKIANWLIAIVVFGIFCTIAYMLVSVCEFLMIVLGEMKGIAITVLIGLLLGIAITVLIGLLLGFVITYFLMMVAEDYDEKRNNI